MPPISQTPKPKKVETGPKHRKKRSWGRMEMLGKILEKNHFVKKPDFSTSSHVRFSLVAQNCQEK
jgi:hypothetical protein